MKLAVIGFGNAGSKIADTLLQYEFDTGRSLCRSVLAVNSARVDLARLESIPQDRQLLIGQTDERVKGHGVGSDPDLGAEITRQDHGEIERALDEVPIYDIDAFLVVAGLGGGTGSGGGPTLASKLRETFEEPVYGLAVLPSEDEGGLPSLNAARSFSSFTTATDNLIVFDNNSWRGGSDTVESGYERTNREIAKRVVTLLSAGAIDGSIVSENAMDSSDIHRTLATGGISSIAYAETKDGIGTDRKGLLARFSSDANGATKDGADPATKVNGLVRQAVRSRLTCPASVDSAERALIVVSGPPDALSRKGIESARRWLESTTGSVEVLAGDDPRADADTLSAVVLLSNVTDVSRIKGLQSQAVDAQEHMEKEVEKRDEEIQQLITDEEGKLDPV